MSEGKGKGPVETITEEGKALAVEVYKDGARPTVSAIGEALGSVARLLVAPVKLLADTGNLAVAKVQEKIAAKLSGVPTDRLLPPPATVAGPAMMQVLLLGAGDDVEQLREMFANLLATSMDRDRAASVHPSFVSMLSQLTQDEAWLLKSIDRPDYGASLVSENARHGTKPLGIRTLLGKDLGLTPKQLERAVSNLDRLGILRIDWASGPSDHNDYTALHQLLEQEFKDSNTSSLGGAIRVTALGEDFLNVCVRFKV